MTKNNAEYENNIENKSIVFLMVLKYVCEPQTPINREIMI